MHTRTRIFVGSVRWILASCALLAAATSASAADTVYAVDSGSDALYTIDLGTGAATLIGPLHPDPLRYRTPVGMAIRPSDGEIFVHNNSPAGDLGLSTVDRNTGLATYIGGTGAPTIAFDGDLRLLAPGSGGRLARISTTTGNVVLLFGSGLPTNIRGMDFNPNDGFLYAISGSSAAAVISRIDPTSGTVVTSVALTSTLTGTVPGSIVIDSSGTVHGTTNGGSNNLFEVDATTGVVSNRRTVPGFSPQGMGLLPVAAIAQWDPDHSPIDTTQPYPATFVVAQITADDLDSNGLVGSMWANAYVVDGWPAGGLELERYLTFGVAPDAGCVITYSTIESNIYNNSAGAGDWEIRSSVDGFASAVDSGSFSDIAFDGEPFSADLSALGSQRGRVELRLYTFNNTGATNPLRRGIRGTPVGEGNGLTILGALDCTCPADLDGSGAVDFGDILAILSAWGNADAPEDLDGSGTVDFGDLLVVLGSWGPCP